MQEHNNTKPLDPAAIARFLRPVGNEYSFQIIDPMTGFPIIAALSVNQALALVFRRPFVLPISWKYFEKEKQPHGSFQKPGMSAGSIHCRAARRGAADHRKYSRNCPGPQQRLRAERVG